MALSVDAELQALTAQWQAAAPAGLPAGLGAMTWELITREVGDWHRFRNRRQVASYTGLCPSEHSSGQTRRQGAITRHGNPRLRHLLIEAVWRRLKFQPQYRAMAKWAANHNASHLYITELSDVERVDLFEVFPLIRTLKSYAVALGRN